MSNSKNNKKRLSGFYIALCCCVLAIGFGGFITEKDKKPVNAPTEEQAVITQTEKKDVSVPVNETIVVEEPTPTASSVAEQPQEPISTPVPETTPIDYTFENPDTEATAIVVNAEEPYFHMPVGGEILDGYSDKLRYDESMGDWRTHNGIDISAEVGASVSACADGIVEDIFEDAFGHGVSLKHKNGFISKYMCLGGTENLEIGKEVKVGEVIGTIGPKKGENIAESHLHFEMHDGDTILNPQQYLN